MTAEHLFPARNEDLGRRKDQILDVILAIKGRIWSGVSNDACDAFKSLEYFVSAGRHKDPLFLIEGWAEIRRALPVFSARLQYGRVVETLDNIIYSLSESAEEKPRKRKIIKIFPHPTNPALSQKGPMRLLNTWPEDFELLMAQADEAARHQILETVVVPDDNELVKIGLDQRLVSPILVKEEATATVSTCMKGVHLRYRCDSTKHNLSAEFVIDPL